MPENNARGRAVKSDERLFDIVEFIREQDGAGVTEIASEVGLAKSTVHGHLTSLRRRGYVVKTDDGYRLGLEFLNHGKYVQTSYSLYTIGQQKVKQLAAKTDERAWCVVEENGLGYYLTGAEGDHPVHPPARIGQRVHLHPLASGKAILAHLPESRVDEIVDQHGLPEITSNTITDEDELFAELERTRERGYAVNNMESLSGLYAIGAPVVDETGVVRGALSISGPKNRLKAENKQHRFVDLLLGATNELEINIRNHRSM
ncbi:IclR family transcriptional regulator [Natrialbaceae archaeon AArc-T1-2]|uniref:IclR family transcriptional regulator n=1 Tax=Natrialbaceae archaeon AArc-T1-2 TaxID=3053904 RepID=UPI00255B3245|nr:IclR family transcriptional regulator [Natrialbaceae archaeon AArc-T1-2]WIV67034.1 IclR family transcriptional regulator [Natrialbaceae archaeon AArc-T1-2]